jgi:hypothetical protein
LEVVLPTRAIKKVRICTALMHSGTRGWTVEKGGIRGVRGCVGQLDRNCENVTATIDFDGSDSSILIVEGFML